jgi:hypothetical protein
METGLTTKEQQVARKILLDCGVIDEIKRGVPATMYYKVNEKKLSELVRQTAENSSLEKTPNCNAENAKLNYPKRQTTTEITTETTTNHSLSTLKTTTESDFSKSANQRERESFVGDWRNSLVCVCVCVGGYQFCRFLFLFHF